MTRQLRCPRGVGRTALPSRAKRTSEHSRQPIGACCVHHDLRSPFRITAHCLAGRSSTRSPTHAQRFSRRERTASRFSLKDANRAAAARVFRSRGGRPVVVFAHHPLVQRSARRRGPRARRLATRSRIRSRRPALPERRNDSPLACRARMPKRQARDGTIVSQVRSQAMVEISATTRGFRPGAALLVSTRSARFARTLRDLGVRLPSAG